jgi:hypothetical protein
MSHYSEPCHEAEFFLASELANAFHRFRNLSGAVFSEAHRASAPFKTFALLSKNKDPWRRDGFPYEEVRFSNRSFLMVAITNN